MTKRLPVLLFVLAASWVTAPSLWGQSVLQVSVTANGQTSNVAPGGSLALTGSNLGQPILANVTVLYSGTATATITGVSVTGTSEMTLLLAPPAPATLNPKGSTSFTVEYLPSSGNAVSAQVSVAFTENSQASNFPFTLTGTSPRLAFSYYFAPSGALTNLNSGDSIIFPATNVGSSVQAVVSVLNGGTATGSLQSVSVSGSAFQLKASAAPVQLQPGQQASFNVVFTPQATGGSQGLLTVGLGSSTVTVALAGTGTSTAFSVSYALADGNIHPLLSGTAISFPSVDINGTTTATITILNQGTGTGSVTGISVAGAGFQLSGLPLLPATVPAGQSLRFGIVFAPTQTGAFNGNFSISVTGTSISGTLAGSTNAPNLTASYTLANANASPLFAGAVISFPAVDINGTATATVTVLNQGAGAGTVTSVGVSGAGFQVSGLPPLPATVPVGQSLRFNILFSPTQAGSFNGTYSIVLTGNTLSGSLTGSTTAPNLNLSYTLADSIVHALSPGTTITFPAIDINGSTAATITIANQGTGSGTVTAVSLSGSGFQLSGVPLLPATIAAGQNLRIGMVFNPTQAGTFSGSFRIDLTGTSISGSLSGSTAASSISLSYIDPNTSNVLPLSNNSTLPFPSTLSGSVATITVVASNSGAGTGFINAVTLSGASSSAFQVVNLPSLPLSVPPSQQARFGVRFSPQLQQSFSAQLQVNINGQSTTINLAAQGTGPQYTYAWTGGNGATALPAGGTLPISDTAVGQTTSVSITITNAGNGDGQIAAVSLTGQGLSLSGVPAGSFTLHPGGMQQFTMVFAPQQPGNIKGQLAIGNDTFTVTANAIGSKLSYMYTNTAAATTVTEGGVVIFPPSAVGSSESLSFSIQNTGTSAATISSISLTASSAVFSLQQLPGLPLSLNPGSTITFAAGFLPNNTGTLTATLAVNTSVFTLSGTGTQPAALPAYQFQGPANPQPAQQSAVSLSLASPYPLALQGTLTLTFATSVFTDDPSIQFANGGRTINFTIPANTTNALFTGGATAVPMQTGTSAGTLTITPSFAMQGGFNMTPTAPNVFSLTIPRAAPQLLAAGVTSETLNSFTVNVSGYSTSRKLSQLDIQITPKQGSSFSSSHLTIDVSASSSAWFQGTASQAFGGTFLLAIPFTLQNGSTTDDLVHLLQSLSITATNDVGVSSAISLSIP